MQPRSERAVFLMECTTTTSEEETVFKRQPGLRCGCWVHAASSADVEAAIGGGKREVLGVGGYRP